MMNRARSLLDAALPPQTDIRQIPGGCEARIALLAGLSNANRTRREQEAIQAGRRLHRNAETR